MFSVPQITFFIFILLAAFVKNVNLRAAKLDNGTAGRGYQKNHKLQLHASAEIKIADKK